MKNKKLVKMVALLFAVTMVFAACGDDDDSDDDGETTETTEVMAEDEGSTETTVAE